MMIRSMGHLNPGSSGVIFNRFTIGLPDLVRHVWVVRWDVPAGQHRDQRVLTYPACNAVIMPGDASLHGPEARVQVRRLVGRSWAVGVLLRPAAAPLLTTTPSKQLVATAVRLAGAPITTFEEVMAHNGSDASLLPQILRDWLGPFAARLTARGRLVNEICAIAETREDIVTVDELAEEAGMSGRSLVRLVQEFVGVNPKWLIECRRLQHAATRLFNEPGNDLASLAAELGFADQAHFTRRYHQVLDETPGATRRAGARAAGQEQATDHARPLLPRAAGPEPASSPH